MHCDSDVCPNCQYISEGDSLCDVLMEIVLDDWAPTEHFMGAGCPYLKLSAGKRRRKMRRRNRKK